MGRVNLGEAVGNSLRHIDGKLYELRKKGCWRSCGACVAGRYANEVIKDGRTNEELQALCSELHNARLPGLRHCMSRGLRYVSYSELAPNGLPADFGKPLD